MRSKIGVFERERCGSVIGAFYAVYNYYGPGLLETVYSCALEDELIQRGHRVDREMQIAVAYKGRRVGWQRIDIIVDDKIIVELKATEAVPEFAKRQILSYLNATPLEIGLLLHFGREPQFEKYVDTLDRRRRGPFARRA